MILPGLSIVLSLAALAIALITLWRSTQTPEVQDQEPRAPARGSQTEEPPERYRDALTGLANRELLVHHLDRALAKVNRNADAAFGVLLIDLDRFKLINESLGQSLGDQVLEIAGQRLVTCCRQEDSVARLGADTFAVFIEEVEQVRNAARIADRIRKEIGRPMHLKTGEVFTSASIGIVLCDDGKRSAQDLLRDAEIAMNRANNLGGGRHEIFDRAMHEHAVARLRLETDLRRALERDELDLYFQPIVDLSEDRIHAFEALLRWRHPERGLLLPRAFLDCAVETGLIVPITWWVLRRVCELGAQWAREVEHDRFSISINLPGSQFTMLDLVDRVEDTLTETGLAPGCLSIEITESAIMGKADTVLSTLRRLRDLGVHLWIDDFGTGYSSLSYLQQLPIECLKIDRSFVAALDGGTESLEIVRAIIDLARNLGLEVIAEGVETEPQADCLKSLGCHLAQGFLVAKPMNTEAAAALLRAAAVNPPTAMKQSRLPKIVDGRFSA